MEISNPGPENLYHLLLKNIREKMPPTIAPVPAKTKKHVMYKTQVINNNKRLFYTYFYRGVSQASIPFAT